MEDLASGSLGQRAARVREYGAHSGGPLGHGLMLECRVPSGHVAWTMGIAPDGRKIIAYPDGTEVWHPAEHVPSRTEGQLLFAVPSRRYPERVEHVKMAFAWDLAERVSCGEIAKRLNAAGAHPPGGRVWYSSRVQSLLTMPGYTGYGVIGRRKGGRYYRLKDGLPAPVDGTKNGRRPRSEWTWSREPAFAPPIISRDDFEATLNLMEEQKRGPRVGKNPDLVLSGFVYCSCGHLMSGATIRQPGRAVRLVYSCSQYITHRGRPPSGCRANQVRQDYLLELIECWMAETGGSLRVASTGDEEGLLRELYAQRDAAKEGPREARRAAERWLAEALDAAGLGEPTEGARRNYRLGHWEVTLPDCRNHSDFVDALSWLSAGEGAKGRKRLAELEAQHDQLFRALVVMPTDAMRAKCQGEVRRVEAEISELRTGAGGVAGRLRELQAEFFDVSTKLAKARRVSAGDDLRRKARAIREVVERVEVRHALVPRSAASPDVLVSKLESVTIVPKVASSECEIRGRASCGRRRSR